MSHLTYLIYKCATECMFVYKKLNVSSATLFKMLFLLVFICVRLVGAGGYVRVCK